MSESTPIYVGLVGAALMVLSSTLAYNLAGEDCLDAAETSMEEYTNCTEKLADNQRFVYFLDSLGYPILLFSLVLAIVGRK